MIESPSGQVIQVVIKLEYKCTNNQVEYESLIVSLDILLRMNVSSIDISGDSQPVVNQLSSEYKCNSLALVSYYALPK